MAWEEEPPGVPEPQGEDDTSYRFLPTFDFHSCHCLSCDATLQ